MRDGSKTQRAAGLLSSILGLVVLSSCNVSEDVKIHDQGVLFPTFRGSVGLIGPAPGSLIPIPAAARAEKAAGSIQPCLSIEGEFSYGSGDSSQIIAAGEHLDFRGVQFTGPAKIDSDYDLAVGEVGARGGMWIERMVGIEGIAGVAVESFDLEIESGGIRDSKRFLFVGPLVGAQLSVRPIPGITFYGRATGLPGLGGGDYVSSLKVGELGLEVMPVPWVGIFGGWRWVGLNLEHDDATRADIRMEVSGPVAGIHLAF